LELRSEQAREEYCREWKTQESQLRTKIQALESECEQRNSDAKRNLETGRREVIDFVFRMFGNCGMKRGGEDWRVLIQNMAKNVEEIMGREERVVERVTRIRKSSKRKVTS
jgi:hypothetical protein